MSRFDAQPRARSRTPIRARLVAAVIILLGLCAVDFALWNPIPPPVVSLQFTRPSWPEGDREPFLCTGVSGAADFLYVTYIDPETIAFGYDSWGAGGPTSPPVKIKPDETVTVRVRMPAIANLRRGADENTLQISIPQRLDWRATVGNHRCTPGQIEWAWNDIGGTACPERAFATLRTPSGHVVRGVGTKRYYRVPELLRAWRPHGFRVLLPYALCALAIAWVGAQWGGRTRAWFATRAETEAASPFPSRAADHYEAYTWLSRLPARPFLIGFLVAFGGCVLAGHWASRQVLFRSFLRFFQPIQPQTYFYPTAHELVSYVERTVPREKRLVLVGGASYFRGTGQNPSGLWTRDLQRRLGDGYAVVNFAIDQAGPPAFAAVAFQALAREYPHMIYVTTGGTFSDDPTDGGDVYRYIYWDAYYKGMLPMSKAWRERVQLLIEREERDRPGQELHLGKRIDAVAYACDLWSWVGYRGLFTVWADSYPLHPFRPRGAYHEAEDPNMAEHQRHAREAPEYRDLMIERGHGGAKMGYVQDSGGEWHIDPTVRKSIAARYDRMLPRDVRGRTLVVLLHGNPFFESFLSREERARIAEMFDIGDEEIRREGYRCLQVGKGFSADDYVDVGHFMASGGRKIAAAVAADLLSNPP